MSKGIKNINIEVNKITNKEVPTWEVVIPNQKTLGVIEQHDKNFHTTMQADQRAIVSKTLEAAINDLISYYNLHENKR